MAADLHVGSVYYEQAGGDDAQPNILQFTFQGGAAGTQLTRIVIDGDKDGHGMSSGDVFFDTAPGGLGAFNSNPLKIVSHDGFQVVNTQVVDGGMRMVIDLSGFDVGEKLVLSVDVDEAQFVDPDNGDIDTNAVVEGGEFQRSHFIASFTAPHYRRPDHVGPVLGRIQSEFLDARIADRHAPGSAARSLRRRPGPGRLHGRRRGRGAADSAARQPLGRGLCRQRT